MVGLNSISDDGEESSKRRTRCTLCVELPVSFRPLISCTTIRLMKLITEQEFVLKGNDCRSCAQYMEGHLLDLSVALVGEIKKSAIERVKLITIPATVLCLRCLTVAYTYVAGSLTRRY